ncbi:MAG: DNA polymerase III subunit gamma/tau [Treponema sp.]|jgi:DNA polymerase-3 subunit gamma/tau|nr:DNA polymerase III subunit gamma/tau [Treponema sp.]
MSYEVTATRRRPKTFDELAGQDFVAATLKSSIETGRVAHAYLFSGPRGCGKTSAARILARSLNCEQGPTATPCGECPSCREIARGASLDIIEIDGASNNSVDNVRQIRDEVIFPPHGGKKKIYIIDEVHMLSSSAFNALLKTVEEPPEYIVFIFATTEVHKVPATIRSRCQQFNFRLIPLETIQGILKETCVEMGIEAEDEALFWIARESTGSLRDAYTLFDQVASFSEGHIRSRLIRDKLGLVGLDQLNALAEACAVNDTAGAFAQIDGILDGGVAIEQFVIDLAGYYRSLLLLSNGVTRESLLGYGPDRFSAPVREKLDSQRLEQALSLLLDLYRDIRYSVSPRFELETAVSKLSWLDRWVSPQEMRAAIAGARSVLEAGKGGLAGPLAGPGRGAPAFHNETSRAVPDRPFSGPPVAPFGGDLNFNQPGALSEAFRQQMAARKTAESAILPETVLPAESAIPAESALPVEAALPADAAEQAKPEGAAVPRDLPALREALIHSLGRDRRILASGIEKTLPWKWEDPSGEQNLLIPAPDTLTAELLKKERPLLRQILGELWGKALSPEVIEIPDEDEGQEPEIPPQAELVRRMFRGTVVKKIVTEKNKMETDAMETNTGETIDGNQSL